MTSNRVANTIKYLWKQTRRIEDGYLYAILDCARNDDIYPMLQRSSVEKRCLFDGAIAYELTVAAPHIVRFHRGSKMLRWLVEIGWGRGWGVFFTSAAHLIPLRAHFREFFVACDEKGKVFYFRFYDPRVMRIYLPTCVEKELKTVFGPVAAYLMEEKNEEEIGEYRFENSRLAVNRESIKA